MIKSKITIDVGELERKHAYHVGEAEKIRGLIDSIKEYCTQDEDEVKETVSSYKQKTLRDGTKMAQALQICEDMLKNGEVVNTAQQFLDKVKEKGVDISIKSVNAALTKSSNIQYNKDKKQWELR